MFHLIVLSDVRMLGQHWIKNPNVFHDRIVRELDQNLVSFGPILGLIWIQLMDGPLKAPITDGLWTSFRNSESKTFGSDSDPTVRQENRSISDPNVVAGEYIK